MTSDLEQIEPISRAASGRTIGNELAFTYPDVSRGIGLCTKSEIAVLGVEVFEVRGEGYATKNLSIYDQRVGSGPNQREGGRLRER